MPLGGTSSFLRVRLNERWIWVGDTTSADDAGIVIYADFPGQWWLARGSEMAGPFDDRCVLRALRVACTPVIDGCEKGPGKSGFLELEERRPLKSRPKQYERTENELPPSTTVYDEEGLKPAVGCCTTFDAPPRVVWRTTEDWESFLDGGEPAYGGVLDRTWNAHPRGSLVFCGNKTTFAGLAIVDLAPPMATQLP
jgi:hypothetical protein